MKYVRPMHALFVLIAVSLALPSVAIPAGAAGGPVTGVFDWSMPSRYKDWSGTAVGFGDPRIGFDDVSELFDTNEDGIPDSEHAAQLREFVNPSSWRVDFNACDLQSPTAIVAYEWQIDLPESVDVSTMPSTKWELDGCNASYPVPNLGEYTISVTATNADGDTTIEQQIPVKDILLVGMGDSYGSGEGQPDVPYPTACPNGADNAWETFWNHSLPGLDKAFRQTCKAGWSNLRCHRSTISDQALTARRLEKIDPRTSVTFLHVACSGAQVGETDPSGPGYGNPDFGGLLAPYNGADADCVTEEPGRDPCPTPTPGSPQCNFGIPSTCRVPLPPQVDQVGSFLDSDLNGYNPTQATSRDRDIDAVLLSGGGNDAQFVPLMDDCAHGGVIAPSPVPCFAGEAGRLFKDFLGPEHGSSGPSVLERRYATLAATLNTELHVPGGRVIQRAYPDPTLGSERLLCPAMLDVRVYETAHPWWVDLILIALTGGLLEAAPLSLMDLREVWWAASLVTPTLNAQVLNNAKPVSEGGAGFTVLDPRPGWQGAVDGIGHGECAGDNAWVGRLPQSMRDLGGIGAVMHPLAPAQWYHSSLMLDALRAPERGLLADPPDPDDVDPADPATYPDGPNAAIDVTVGDDGVYTVSDVSTSTVPISDRAWSLDRPFAKVGGAETEAPRSFALEESDFVCDTARVGLTVVDEFGSQDATTRVIHRPRASAPQSTIDAAQIHLTDPVLADAYREPDVSVETWACGQQGSASGAYEQAQVGQPSCLAPTADGQYVPAGRCDGLEESQAGYGSVALPRTTSQEHYVASIDSSFSTDPQCCWWSEASQDGFQYLVQGPPGTTVQGEFVVETAEDAGTFGRDEYADARISAFLGQGPCLSCYDSQLAYVTSRSMVDRCDECTRSIDLDFNGFPNTVALDRYEYREFFYSVEGPDHELRDVNPESAACNGADCSDGYVSEERSPTRNETPYGTLNPSTATAPQVIERRTARVPFAVPAGTILFTSSAVDVSLNPSEHPEGASAQVRLDTRIETSTPGVSIVPLSSVGQPVLSVDDVRVTEGNVKTTPVEVPVRLTEPSSQPVTVQYATAEGTALKSDFVGKTGTLTFKPGETIKKLVLNVKGDVRDEDDDETYRVVLANSTNAVIGARDYGTVTIADDDDTPTLSIGDATLVEGDAKTVPVNLTVTLSQPAAYDVPISFVTADDSATAGLDYITKASAATIRAGATQSTVRIVTKPDDFSEQDEFFDVILTSGGPTVLDDRGRVTIVDDDTGPANSSVGLSVGDVTVVEGHAGPKNANVTVTLTKPLAADAAVTLSTASIDAQSGADFASRTATLTMRRGVITKTFVVRINGDLAVEPDERLAVNVTAPGVSTLRNGVVTIRDDDALREPDAPIAVTARSSSLPDRVVVLWHAPTYDGGLPILKYEARVKPASQAWRDWQDVSGGAAATSAVLGCPGGTVCDLELRAVNLIGAGQAALAQAGAYGVAVLPGAPASVTAIAAATAGSATLAWLPPVDDGNAPITGYWYDVSTDGGTTWAARVLAGDASTRSKIVVCGAPGAACRYRMYARNLAGFSAASESVVFVVPAAATVPTPPHNLVATVPGPPPAPQLVVLAWQAPSSDGGSPLISYVVEVSSNGGPWLLLVMTPPTQRSFNAPCTAASGQTCQYRVSARNAIGTGNPSNVVTYLRP